MDIENTDFVENFTQDMQRVLGEFGGEIKKIKQVVSTLQQNLADMNAKLTQNATSNDLKQSVAKLNKNLDEHATLPESRFELADEKFAKDVTEINSIKGKFVGLYVDTIRSVTKIEEITQLLNYILQIKISKEKLDKTGSDLIEQYTKRIKYEWLEPNAINIQFPYPCLQWLKDKFNKVSEQTVE